MSSTRSALVQPWSADVDAYTPVVRGAQYRWRKTLRLAASALWPHLLDQVLASPKNLNPAPTAIEAALAGRESKTIRVCGRRDLRRPIDAVLAAPPRKPTERNAGRHGTACSALPWRRVGSQQSG